jgi:hypothetical protein
LEATSLIGTEPSTEITVCGRSEDRRVRCFVVPHVPSLHEPSPRLVEEPSIRGLGDLVELVAAPGFANLTCALTAPGAVHCWGDGQYGQLGAPVVPTRKSAAPVVGLPPVVELGVAREFACARTSAGQVYCWGSNRSGGVPDGAPGLRTEPVAVRWPR